MNFKVENIGQYLKEKRKEKALTLSEVATMLNLTPGYISRIERGTSKPSKSVLHKICNIYQVPISKILNDNGELDLDNIKVGTDLLSIINNDYVTYNGDLINAQDRINIGLIVKSLLEINNIEDKNNFMNIIISTNKIIKNKERM